MLFEQEESGDEHDSERHALRDHSVSGRVSPQEVDEESSQAKAERNERGNRPWI